MAKDLKKGEFVMRKRDDRSVVNETLKLGTVYEVLELPGDGCVRLSGPGDNHRNPGGLKRVFVEAKPKLVEDKPISLEQATAVVDKQWKRIIQSEYYFGMATGKRVRLTASDGSAVIEYYPRNPGQMDARKEMVGTIDIEQLFAQGWTVEVKA